MVNRSVESDSPVVTGTSHRENNIDALRLILALLVIYSHSFPAATGTEDFEPLKVFSQGQLTFGAFAVDGFFILSGYLISQSWERSRSTASYIKKRIYRIYPGYIVAVAVCIWVIVPIASPNGAEVFSWQTLIDNSWRILLLRGFVAPDAFLNNPIPKGVNGALWTIPFEFECYMGVVFLGLTGLFRRRRLILAFFLISILIHFWFEWTDCKTGGKLLGVIFGYPRFWARLLPLFLAGMVMYQFRSALSARRSNALFAFICLVIAMRVPYGVVFAMPTCGAYLFFYCAFTSDVKWHSASKYGDFSYGIYLYGHPIQQLVMYVIGRPIAPMSLFAIAFVPVVLAGVLSWYLVERWFQVKTASHPFKGPGDSIYGTAVQADPHDGASSAHLSEKVPGQ